MKNGRWLIRTMGPFSSVVLLNLFTASGQAAEPRHTDAQRSPVDMSVLDRSLNTQISLPTSAVHVSPEILVPLVCAQNARAIFESLENDIAKARVNAERSIFEPVLRIEAGRTRTKVESEATEVFSQGQIYDEQSNAGFAGVEGLIPTGGQWKLGTRIIERKSDVIRDVRESDAEYKTVLEVSFRQPLLRGFGSDITLSKAHIAEAEQDITFQRYRLRLMELAGEALAVYWDLYRSQHLLEAQTESLRVAERLLQSVENLSAGGKLPRTQVLEARAGMVERRSRLIQAQRAVVEAKSRIWELVGAPQDAGQAGSAYVAARKPSNSATVSVNYDQSLERALQNWPEHLLLDHKLRRESLQIDYAQDQLRPDLSLVTSYGTSGLGTEFDRSRRTAFSDDFKTWFIGLELRMPLFGNNAAESQLDAARLRHRQAQLEKTAVRTTLERSIVEKVEMVRALQAQLQQDMESSRLNQEMLQASIARLEAGHGDVREILDREEDLNEAKRIELRAVVELEKSLAVLDLAEGVLLDKYQVLLHRSVDQN